MNAKDVRSLSLIAVLTFAATARTAIAADPLPALAAPSPELTSKPEQVWYGWQPLAADTASIVALGFTLARPLFEHDTPANSAWIPAALTFALAAPIIHVVHGNTESGMASFALHAGAPFVLGAIGYFAGIPLAADGDVMGGAFLDGMLIGTIAGVAAATIIDASVLSFDKPDSATFVPTFTMTREHTTFGVAIQL